MKKFSVLILVLLVFSSLWGISAMATQLRGQPLGSVENVVTAIGVDPALKKIRCCTLLMTSQAVN